MMTVSVYLLNVIDAINQSDQPVPCRAGEDARFFKWTAKLVGLDWDRCGAEVYLKTDGWTDGRYNHLFCS